MAESALVRKLGLKEGHRALIMNAPDGYVQTLGALPPAADVQTSGGGEFDVVQVFVRTRADVDGNAETALGKLRPGGILWFAYPKRSSKVQTDITRDVGWDALRDAGWRPVSQIAIDDTWSALRFRPVADVKPRRRP